jgi:hypothetical protein
MVENCTRWTRDRRVLVEQTGNRIEIKACEVSEEDQAAICYVLLSGLAERCGIAPFAITESQLSVVEDCLASIAEFPDINRR